MTIEQDANSAEQGQDAGAGEGGGQGQQQEQGQEQGGEFKGNSLMTKGGEGKPDSGKDAGKEPGKDAKKDDPADKIPDKPEGYALKFAEGIQVDQELLGDFTKAAHELGISQGKAQKLADMYAAHAAKTGERMLAEQQKALEAAKTRWEGEIEKSPNFVQERDCIRAALRQYGDQELYELLDQTNLGSHPKMWSFMAKIGKALAEPGFKGQSAGRGQKTAAEIMYPNQGKE